LAVAGAIFGALLASVFKAGEATLLDDLIRKGPTIILSGAIAGAIYTAMTTLVVHARRKQLDVDSGFLEAPNI